MSRLRHSLAAWRSPRVALLLALGFSSGLPYALTGSTLAAWMENSGVALRTIGLFSLVALPYSFKFLWAPLCDRFAPRWLGRRRGWMVLTQVALIAVIAALGGIDPRASPVALVALAALLAFLSATQDIVCDAYRADLLPDAERAPGTATFILGYRIAMLCSGALALVLSSRLPWSLVYRVMAGGMLVGVVATLYAPEPAAVRPPRTLRAAVAEPFADYFRRRGALWALAFILLYKMQIALPLQVPFLIRSGFSNAEIGMVHKGLGLGAAIVGTLVAGTLVSLVGARRSLFAFGLYQVVAGLGWLALALAGKSYPMLLLAVGAEQLSVGLTTTALDAYLISLCHRRFSATQYALFTSASGLLMRLPGGASGAVQSAVGWPAFFAINAALALPALAALALLPAGAATPAAATEPPPQPQKKAADL